jgi:hypothetical protein
MARLVSINCGNAKSSVRSFHPKVTHCTTKERERIKIYYTAGRGERERERERRVMCGTLSLAKGSSTRTRNLYYIL